MLATQTISRIVICQEIPTKHNNRADQSATDHKNDVSPFLQDESPSACIIRIQIFNLKVQLIDFKVAKCSNGQIDYQQTPTHDHPIIDHAIIPQVEVSVLQTTTISQGYHKPQNEITTLEYVDSPLTILLYRFVLPVENAEDVKNVQTDPKQQIAYGGQHEKFLEEKIIQCQQQSLEESQQVKPALLCCDLVVAFSGDGSIAFPEERQHADADQSFKEPQRADED